MMSIKELEDPFIPHQVAAHSELGLKNSIGGLSDQGVLEREPMLRRLQKELDKQPFFCW
jgi:hypothetical protein